MCSACHHDRKGTHTPFWDYTIAYPAWPIACIAIYSHGIHNWWPFITVALLWGTAVLTMFLCGVLVFAFTPTMRDSVLKAFRRYKRRTTAFILDSELARAFTLTQSN